MTEELKLRECPFCGADAVIRPYEGSLNTSEYNYIRVECSRTCVFAFYYSHGRALKNWNTRAPSTELTQLVKAARIALGRMTGGMDGYWAAGVNEVELLREALVPFKEVGE